MRSIRWAFLLFAVAAASGACGDEYQGSGGSTTTPPADIAGAYTIAVTNGDNGCMLMNWTQGASTTNIDFTITQDGSHAVGALGGLAGAYADLVLGAHTFEGEVTADSFTMTCYGTTQGKTGGCSYTFNAVLDGTINGDAIQGTVRYEPQTNGSPDCGVLNSCSSEQQFSGVRPPKGM